ncbi:MAG: hypothetical protein FWC38_02110, partial [Proteobacteria bacterium]|nr:hypothetical protein [Pseudomonadota bacterium]
KAGGGLLKTISPQRTHRAQRKVASLRAKRSNPEIFFRGFSLRLCARPTTRAGDINQTEKKQYEAI